MKGHGWDIAKLIVGAALSLSIGQLQMTVSSLDRRIATIEKIMLEKGAK